MIVPLTYKDTMDFKNLNIDQKIAFCAAMNGENMLVTGGGGVGKSHFIQMLARHKENIVLSASTGVAAININGSTLSSALGFFRTEPLVFDLENLSNSVINKFKKIETLLIDEFSMTRIDQFELVDKVLKGIHDNDKPFGGVQLIVIADFCQLKPILTRDYEYRRLFQRVFRDRIYGFESELFTTAKITPYVFANYIRNENNEQCKALRCLRVGHNIEKSISYINSIVNYEIPKNAIHLCTTNKQADAINEDSYNNLPGQEKTFYASIKNDGIDCPVGRVIKMKINTRIMLITNNPEKGYFNGDVGTIVGFTKDAVQINLDRGVSILVEQYEWTDKPPYSSSKNYNGIKQIPLKLAYAITIHKSQGMTLDCAVLNLMGGVFSEFQAYVGLSRVRDLRNLTLLRPLQVSDITINERAVDFTCYVSKLALDRRDEDINKFGLKEKAA